MQVVPAAAAKPAAAGGPAAAAAKPVVKSPPVFELRDKKWVVEFQENGANIVIDQGDIRQTVYIYK